MCEARSRASSLILRNENKTEDLDRRSRSLWRVIVQLSAAIGSVQNYETERIVRLLFLSHGVFSLLGTRPVTASDYVLFFALVRDNVETTFRVVQSLAP